MNTQPPGDDSTQSPTHHRTGHGQRRCLDQRREVTMQIRRTDHRSFGQRVRVQRTVLLRGIFVSALFVGLGVAVALTAEETPESAGAAAAPIATVESIAPSVPMTDPTLPATVPPTTQDGVASEAPTTTTAESDPGEPADTTDARGTTTDDRGSDIGDRIDPGGVDPNGSDDVEPGDVLPPDPPPNDCGTWGDEDGDGDGIPSRWDRQPCVTDHVSAAAPCESYAGNPVEDPFGDWDRDGVSNQSDSDPCDPTVTGTTGGDDPACEVSESGSGDGDSDGIPDRWDFDPCVPDHVSAAAPCLSYDGDPSEDPSGDWDMDDASNANDPAPCDPGVF